MEEKLTFLCNGIFCVEEEDLPWLIPLWGLWLRVTQSLGHRPCIILEGLSFHRTMVVLKVICRVAVRGCFELSQRWQTLHILCFVWFFRVTTLLCTGKGKKINQLMFHWPKKGNLWNKLVIKKSRLDSNDQLLQIFILTTQSVYLKIFFRILKYRSLKFIK
jgi:hypothetical protein